MSRWLPYPLISFWLLVLWLTLNQSLAPAHILFGALLGFYGGRLLQRLDAPPGVFRRPKAVIKLFLLVLDDVVRSNIAVARIILHRGTRNQTSGFVEIPLEITHPYALTILSLIITSCPGTLWVDYEPGRKVMLLHVLDLVDEDEWREIVQTRYEILLKEIFE